MILAKDGQSGGWLRQKVAETEVGSDFVSVLGKDYVGG